MERIKSRTLPSIPFFIILYHKPFLYTEENQILTSIKGRNPVANLRKTMIYNTNVDLANDNEYAKFSLNLSIRSQDIMQKPNSDVNQRP